MRVWIVIVLAAIACGSNKPRYRPGDDPGCAVASCCAGGWFYDGLSCRPVTPPFCGCTCKGPTPTTYPTEQECVAQASPKP